MKANLLRKITIVIYIFVSALFVSNASAFGPPPLPNPVLVFNGQEPFSRDKYFVFNADAYPDSLFAEAPSLPPCGKNTKASRTWVDLFDQSGKRLFGFCAIDKPAGLNTIWFALDAGVLPPSWIYIEMKDRQTDTKYKSNLAETTL